jgi:DnaJ family protein C protein 7
VRQLQSRIPKRAWQAFVKAQHFAETARTGQAIGQLQRAVALDPDWRDAHLNLGVQLVRTGRIEEGWCEFQQAIRIGPPSPLVYTNGAAALAGLHRPQEGEKLVREALRLDPSYQRAHYMLGHILASQPGKETEALDHLRRAAAEVPSARMVAAQVLLRSGDKRGAAAELRSYLNSGDATHRKQAEESLAHLQ